MQNLIGKRFTRLLVLEFSHRDEKNPYWKCLCDCGTVTITRQARLLNGDTKSCGCLIRDVSAMKAFKHGHYANGNNNGSDTYICWRGMMARCYKPESTGFKNYGGRGISVCESWHDYQNFLSDMGERPDKQHSVGRINNEGNYEPGNCRWETKSEQCNNTRVNRIETYNGVTDTITRLARLNGHTPMRVISRLHCGWSVEDALGTPVSPNMSASLKRSWDFRKTKERIKQHEHKNTNPKGN